MTEQRTEREELARAADADALLAHPLITEALASYETEIVEAWKNSSPRSVEDREKLKAMLTAAQHFRRYLQTVSETGKLIRAKVQPSTVERLASRMRLR